MQDLRNPIVEAVTDIISTSIVSPSDQDHYCKYCGTLVPKRALPPLTDRKGRTRVITIQPVCKCEAEAFDKGFVEAAEHQQKKEIERKFSISALGERFQECKFDRFTTRPGAEKAVEYARSYARNFPDYGGDSLLIWGEPGNGKSHLAAAICHEIKGKGYIPVFQSVPVLLERIRNTFGGRQKETEKEIMDAVRDCDLLVLDDIGAEKISDWVMDVMFRIIDGRYRAKKPTLLTTNYSPVELLHRFMPDKAAKEDEIKAKRIHDRILEASIIVENKASSYRLQVAMERSEKEKRRREWA